MWEVKTESTAAQIRNNFEALTGGGEAGTNYRDPSTLYVFLFLAGPPLLGWSAKIVRPSPEPTFGGPPIL
jgi:hypothetical protein